MSYVLMILALQKLTNRNNYSAAVARLCKVAEIEMWQVAPPGVATAILENDAANTEQK